MSDAEVNEETYRGLVDLKDNGAPDDVVAGKLRKALLELTGGAGSRYDITRDNVAALMRLPTRPHRVDPDFSRLRSRRIVQRVDFSAVFAAVELG